MMQNITVLRTQGPVVAKKWTADGIEQYQNAKYFTFRSAPIEGLRGLFDLLAEMATDPRQCIIRGQPKTNDDVVRRSLEYFDDQPSHLFMIDVDRFDGTVEQFVETLPGAFQDVSYVWQLSGSHGHPSKPGLPSPPMVLARQPDVLR